MVKAKFLFLILILAILNVSISAKEIYIITLKGGTKIKAEAYIEKKNYIKVFKYGGYIIYPKKNVKKIEKINDYSINKKKKDNKTVKNIKSNKKISDKCMPIVKNFEAVPVYDKVKDGFNIKVTGVIDNNCPNLLEDVKLTINFFDTNNNKILCKTLSMDDITSYDSYKFKKIITDNYKGDIKYFNYKLEFVKK